MQTRPYDSKDGSRIWLSRDEQTQLLDSAEEQPQRHIALSLGLHGLRADEIINVVPSHVRTITDGVCGLTIPDGKTGKRETPISDELASQIRMFVNATGRNQDDPLIDVSTRSLRNWIRDARDELGDEYDELGMHDLRRTWATDSFYSLAFAGVPIAEDLVLSWGGWKPTATGRETFRINYLGPVPDHVVEQAVRYLNGSLDE